MFRDKMRVAVCQLECHPALRVNDLDYLGEPFLTGSEGLSLAELGRHNLEMSELQESCKNMYLDWHAVRVAKALQFLADFDPQPDIIVFPEASLPVETLTIVQQHAVRELCTSSIFAGTHTLPVSEKWNKQYRRLGVNKRTIQMWKDEIWFGNQVLPVFSNKQVWFRKKLQPSIFETTDISGTDEEASTLEPIELTVRNNKVQVAPFVCSDALRQYNIAKNHDIAVVCAFAPKPKCFDAFIDHHAGTRRLVVVCNDGTYGGSGVFALVDNRPKIWWWNSPFYGRLPEGDGILVVDVDFADLAPQVAVMTPQSAIKLRCLSSVTFEQGSDSGYDASIELKACRCRDKTAQVQVLSGLLGQKLPPIQRAKLSHLHRLCQAETASDDWWRVLGEDCSIDAQPDLKRLEAIMAKSCASKLTSIISSGEIEDEGTLGKTAKLMVMCNKRVETQHRDVMPSEQSRASEQTIDRDREVTAIRQFLEQNRQVACVVTGISAVGKTCVIYGAIQQAGYRTVFPIRLRDDSSPAYLKVALLRLLGYDLSQNQNLGTEEFKKICSSVLQRNSVLVIENAHYCISHVTWRNPAFAEVFELLLAVCTENECKIVVESAVSMDISCNEPGRICRRSIRGLDKEYGIVMLRRQLRRAGLNPEHYSKEQYGQVVAGVGGHPGAIALASEYIYASSIQQVIEDIEGRRGSHAAIVRAIIKGLQLTEEESLVLAFLSLARRPLPVQTIAGLCSFNQMAVVNALQKLGLVERHKYDHVEVTPLLKSFADLPRLGRTNVSEFHIAAAKAFSSMSKSADAQQELEWAIEAKYHAHAAARPELVPDLAGLCDGAVGGVNQLIKEQEFERAKPIVDQLLKVDKTPELFVLSAQVYAHLGLTEESLTLAREAVSRGAESWILTEVGRLALKTRDLTVAEDAVKLARGMGALTTFITVLEGRICLQQNDPHAAKKSFKRGTEISKDDGWPHFYLGRMLIKEGNLEEAIDVLGEGEEIESRRWRQRRSVLAALRTQLGVAHLLNNDMPNAERWLKLVADEDIGNPEVARAFAYLRVRANQGRVTEAALANLNPRRARNRRERCQVHLFRGLFYLNAGVPGKASEEFQQAHNADPRDILVLLRWSQALFDIACELRTERDSDAAQVCAQQAQTVASKVLEFDKDNGEALRILEKLFDEFHVG